MKNHLILIILFISGVLFLGCITKKGTKVDAPSVGRVITPSELERQPNGSYRLKPIKKTIVPDGIPYNPPISDVKVTSIPVAPIQLKPAITLPKHTEITSAKPKEVLPTAKASGEITPFSPTVTDASNIKVNVLPITNEATTVTNKPEIAGPPAEPTEEEMKINWSELWAFYVAAIMVLIIIWLIYKTAREAKKLKEAKKDASELNKKKSGSPKKKGRKAKKTPQKK